MMCTLGFFSGNLTLFPYQSFLLSRIRKRLITSVRDFTVSSFTSRLTSTEKDEGDGSSSSTDTLGNDSKDVMTFNDG